MAKKTAATIRFEKDAYYEDAKGDLFFCTNWRTRKTAYGNTVVDMKSVKKGKPVGRAEEYTDRFVRKLTKKQLQERLEVDRREAEAIADSEVAVTETEPKAAKKRAARAAKEKKTDGKLSAIDAAAKALGESAEPLTTAEMIEQMAAKKYWTSPGGKTPAATLYSAILREIQKKGNDARFKKTERGKFKIQG